MSRVGKSPIPVSKQVTVNIGSHNLVTVKGPKGEQSLQVDPDILLNLEEGELVLSRPTEQKRHKAMHGLYRSLLHNMVVGVTEGFKKELEVIGVGFRANMQNGVLELALGYSHPIYFVAPEGIEINVDTKRSKNSFIIIEGIDKQMVGQVAAKIRSLRPPEPYKGKGVRYTDEFVRRKAGKTAAR
ncbi:MAG: 50S ribosomal protein L6 [Bacteroidetes bacterium]|nr:50S ribosomal protein L6 [Bacteroidota bacterium]